LGRSYNKEAMRTVGLFALAVLASACTISTGSSRPSAPPPQGPPPAAFAGRAPAPPGQRVVVTKRQPNVGKLRALKQRRAFCAPEEVAPGTWAKFDCKGYTRARNARQLPRLRSTRKGFVGGNVGDVLSTPAAADLRSANLDGPIKDQGAVGTCTAVSLSSAMDVAVRKAGKNDVVSPLHIWSQYAVPNMGMAGEATENDVLASEGSWEYDPAVACQMMKENYDDCGDAYDVQSGTGNDPRIQSQKRAADSAGRHKLTAVEEFPAPHDPEEMAAVIAGGDAVWIAFSIDPAAWQSSNMRDGVVPDYNNVGQAGHAVTLVGYRTVGSGKQFLIHNSWGTRWGQGGYGWISSNMIQRWTRSAYKVVVDGQGGGGGGGGGGNTADGCPTGQSMDRVLRQCANTCPSGSAPSAGVCLPAIPGFPGGGGQQPANPSNPNQGGQQNPFPFPIPGFPLPGGGGGGGGTQPPAGACAAGQVPDGMTGQCANACPGGAAPIGGMCLPGR